MLHCYIRICCFCCLNIWSWEGQTVPVKSSVLKLAYWDVTFQCKSFKVFLFRKMWQVLERRMNLNIVFFFQLLNFILWNVKNVFTWELSYTLFQFNFFLDLEILGLEKGFWLYKAQLSSIFLQQQMLPFNDSWIKSFSPSNLILRSREGKYNWVFPNPKEKKIEIAGVV